MQRFYELKVWEVCKSAGFSDKVAVRHAFGALHARGAAHSLHASFFSCLFGRLHAGHGHHVPEALLCASLRHGPRPEVHHVRNGSPSLIASPAPHGCSLSCCRLTCILLACKVEEEHVAGAVEKLVSVCKVPAETILEYEMPVLTGLRCQLTVFHPLRSLWVRLAHSYPPPRTEPPRGTGTGLSVPPARPAQRCVHAG